MTTQDEDDIALKNKWSEVIIGTKKHTLKHNEVCPCWTGDNNIIQPYTMVGVYGTVHSSS